MSDITERCEGEYRIASLTPEKYSSLTSDLAAISDRVTSEEGGVALYFGEGKAILYDDKRTVVLSGVDETVIRELKGQSATQN